MPNTKSTTARMCVARLGQWLARWLFDAYMQDLIETYVRRERDRWAEAFEMEKARNEAIRQHRDALMNLLIEQANMKVAPLFVSSDDWGKHGI